MHGHSHSAGGGHDHGQGAPARVLAWALAANAALAVAQVLGGLAFGSLSLLADAAHQLVDVVALGSVLLAQQLARRPAAGRRTYGLQRADVLASLACAVLLLASSVWIVLEAIERFGSPVSIDGPWVVALAILGLAVNGGSAYLLVRTASRSLGIRSAVTHLMADAAGSLGVLIAGLAAWLFDVSWVDTVLSLAIAAAVAVAAVQLMRESTHLLLEGAPQGIDPDAVAGALGDEPDVEAVHHLHVWALASDVPAMSAHVQLRGEVTLHEAQQTGDRLKTMLHDRFGIEHTTLELECHPCEDLDHT